MCLRVCRVILKLIVFFFLDDGAKKAEAATGALEFSVRIPS